MVVAVTMVVATIVEKYQGSTYVAHGIYGAWWFVGLWALLGVSSLGYILQRKLFRRPATFLLHLSLLVILAGALVTRLTGIQGTLHLVKGETARTFENSETGLLEQLPFGITLSDFRVECYPGTQSPMDYVSTLTFTGNAGDMGEENVSMNHVVQVMGYRFYQSGFDEDRQGSYLTLSHDPWGIAVTYTGYGLLLLAMLLFMLLPQGGYRQLLRSNKLFAVAMLFAIQAMGSTSSLSAQPKVLPADVATQFANLYTYYNGRICPVQTVAADFTTKLYGKPSYRGYTSEQVLTGWVLFATSWIDEPMIRVKGKKLAPHIGKDDNLLAYTDFLGEDGYKLEQVVEDIHSGKSVDNARAILEADEKLNILLMLFNGQMLRIYPYAGQMHGGNSVLWLSQGSNPPAEVGEERWFFIKKSMDYVGELAALGQYDELGNVLDKIRKYQEKEVGEALPSETLFRAELLYNRLCAFRLFPFLLLGIGLVAFVLFVRAWTRRMQVSRPIAVTFFMLTGIVTAYLLVLISLRGVISGHLPMSNGYETMQFMALCTLLITLCCWRKFQLIPPFGLFIAGLALLVSRMGETNPQITPLMPVLASPLLSLHVCVIMVAYSLFAFTMLNAATALVLGIKGRATDAVRQLSRISLLLLYPALFLLSAGIFIGAVWANQSWGRYWGWDPKEVWALITMLVYAFPLHRASFPWFREPRHFHLYMLLAFLCILMTYFGVNFFLGGMHSYA